MKLLSKPTAAIFLSILGTQLFAQKDLPSSPADIEKQYQENIKKERLNGVYIPRNLGDACAQLSKLTSPEAKEKFKRLPEDSVTMFTHAKLGKWMIVNWAFYEGSRLSHYLRSAGVTYPDDMADFLIVAWHRQLNGKPIELKELVVRFKEKRKKIWEAEKAEKAASGEVILEEKRKKEKPAGGGN